MTTSDLQATLQTVWEAFDEELRCIEPISVAIGESCGECPPCQVRTTMRLIEQRIGELERVAEAARVVGDEGLLGQIPSRDLYKLRQALAEVSE